MPQSARKIAILGGSRGFGKAFTEQASVGHCKSLCLMSRKLNLLEQLAETAKSKDIFAAYHSVDLADEKKLSQAMDHLDEFQPTHIWYIAGGGPYGEFAAKNWKDHQWAMQVSFSSPAQILHEALNNRWSSLQQFVVVGSTVAESQPDPGASSYAAAKHAPKGLITTIFQEQPSLDVRLFSPGYMDTDLLPPNARPRQESQAIAPPHEVAKEFWNWALKGDPRSHFRYENSQI